jgi:hypothetical protein
MRPMDTTLFWWNLFKGIDRICARPQDVRESADRITPAAFWRNRRREVRSGEWFRCAEGLFNASRVCRKKSTD